ncbi:hypothetical protein EYF80_034959 [Liparis tanakae]|uniref:Uncharacterized protein n=1 Tax=Liparis tanakae TaxID=230148 RepID=A0A4Z2GNP8_9TELE|nr:hypothetical protein EYF80_034959 [Liparis tanakae]
MYATLTDAMCEKRKENRTGSVEEKRGEEDPMTLGVTNASMFVAVALRCRAHLSGDVIHSNHPLENDSPL